jgi:hypothetical protein
VLIDAVFDNTDSEHRNYAGDCAGKASDDRLLVEAHSSCPFP